MNQRIKRFVLVPFALLLFIGGSALPHAAQQTSGQGDSENASKKSKTKKPKKADPTATTQAPANVPSAPAPSPESKPAPPATGTGSGAQATNQAPPPAPSGTVWVNTISGIYHKPGSRYYGKTRKGQYMTEADAIRAGYRAAENEKKK